MTYIQFHRKEIFDRNAVKGFSHTLFLTPLVVLSSLIDFSGVPQSYVSIHQGIWNDKNKIFQPAMNNGPCILKVFGKKFSAPRFQFKIYRP